MDLKNIDDLKKAGFVGFKKMGELFTDYTAIPKVKGVYLVLYLESKPPEFLTVGTGGHFKDRDPNVSVDYLKSHWVDNSTIVYIGKAGKDGSDATLQSRLRQYFGFGQGGKVGHWGGRLIWQLKNSKDLVVCWKPLPAEDPRTFEVNLIQQFVSEFTKRPFANLAD